MTRGYWVTFFILVALGALILLKKSMEFRCFDASIIDVHPDDKLKESITLSRVPRS